jgi:undecaprenyl-diphosphatase
MDQLSYLRAVVIGAIQGVTELFPISSLGHSVLIPAWLGGSWETLGRAGGEPGAPYLAFIVGLHVATALALLLLFWRDWVGIIRGFFCSIRHRRIETTLSGSRG